jgi:hypothetical protein
MFLVWGKYTMGGICTISTPIPSRYLLWNLLCYCIIHPGVLVMCPGHWHAALISLNHVPDMGEICHGREMSHISTNTTRIFIIQAAIPPHYTSNYVGYVSGSCPQCIHICNPCSGHGGYTTWKRDATYLNQYNPDIHYSSCYTTPLYIRVCRVCVRVMSAVYSCL